MAVRTCRMDAAEWRAVVEWGAANQLKPHSALRELARRGLRAEGAPERIEEEHDPRQLLILGAAPHRDDA